MKVFIVGASGLVGSHCMNVFKNEGCETIGTHLNFATEETVYFDPLKPGTECFDIDTFKPDVVIHCAALTNVDYCESHAEESETNTVKSTRVLTDYCIKNNAKLVYLSTDYVFNGKYGPYSEEDDTAPINIYGEHKLRAERIVKTLNNYLIARITNVYGEEQRSKNFIARLIQMFQNTEDKILQLPTDQFATPVYAGDVARMLYKLVTDNKIGIYNLSSTDYYTRYSLAERVFSYFPENKTVKLIPVKTKSLNQPANRPLYGGLINIKFVNEYNDFHFTNVDDFINKMIKNEL